MTRVVSIRDPKDAVAHKIGMVHQHFMLIPVFTVAENIMLGSEPVKPWPFIDHQSATERIVALAKEYNFVLDPSATIENLPIGTPATCRNPEGPEPRRRGPYSR